MPTAFIADGDSPVQGLSENPHRVHHPTSDEQSLGVVLPCEPHDEARSPGDNGDV